MSSEINGFPSILTPSLRLFVPTAESPSLYWNYAPPDGTGASYTKPPANRGPERSFSLKLTGIGANSAATVFVLMKLTATSSLLTTRWNALRFLRDQIVKLREARQGCSSGAHISKNGTLTIQVPPQGLAVVLIGDGKAKR